MFRNEKSPFRRVVTVLSAETRSRNVLERVLVGVLQAIAVPVGEDGADNLPRSARDTAAAVMPAGITRDVPVEKFCVTRNIDRVVHVESDEVKQNGVR